MQFRNESFRNFYETSEVSINNTHSPSLPCLYTCFLQFIAVVCSVFNWLKMIEEDEDQVGSFSSFEDAIWNAGALNQSGIWPLGESTDSVERAPDVERRVSVAGPERDVFQDEGVLPGGRRGRVAVPVRLQNSTFFLTYSQTGYDKERVAESLRTKGTIKRMIVANETHADGGRHVHALVEYDRRKDIRPNYFDLGSEHPNILVWTNRNQTYDSWFVNHWDYCCKEDLSPITIGTRPSVERKRKRDETFKMAMEVAIGESVDKGMEFLVENCPYDALTKYAQIATAMHIIRSKKVCTRTAPRTLEEFKNVPAFPPNWKNLFFQGPTNLGKTQLAKALLPEATVVRHRDQLRLCDFSKGVIFDDFDCHHWPPASVIHLLDWDEASGIDVKHGHVIIPAGTRKIFTFNSELTTWAPRDATNAQMDAIRRRIHVVTFDQELY